MSFWNLVKEAKERNKEKVRIESAFDNNVEEIDMYFFPFYFFSAQPIEFSEREGHKLISYCFI